jgi:pSer/pThr/pTyr-binding forkhead associated (FHA) protein
MARSSTGNYVLKFISGKYQGGEFRLDANQEIIIGRSSEVEMVLVEDMVSRQHARIANANNEIWIEDFGSTNGTFVNGEKITKVRLKEGDRILIGTSIIKLAFEEAGESSRPPQSVSAPPPAAVAPASAARLPPRGPAPGHTQHGTLSGVLSGLIDQVPLPDLLQLFGNAKKSGCLIINTGQSEGRIFLREGRVYAAVIDEQSSMNMEKSFYRMMAWNRGSFLLDTTITAQFDNEINESVESMMMEGMRILDEIRNLGNVPDYNATLHLAVPLVPPLRNLSPELLDTLQLVHNYGHVETVLNKSLASDLETLQDVVYLLRNEYLREDT